MTTTQNPYQESDLAKGLAKQVKSLVGTSGTFDSGAAAEVASSIINSPESAHDVPESVRQLLASSSAFKTQSMSGGAVLLNAVFDAGNEYRRAHGVDMPADMLAYALTMAQRDTPEGHRTYDSAVSGLASNATAINPRAPLISFLGMAQNGAPDWIHYLPADAKGEARLGILRHFSGKKAASYEADESLDGDNGGKPLFTAFRRHTCAVAGQNITGKLTNTQLDATCDPAGEVMVFQRGRAELTIFGHRVAMAPQQDSNSTLTGNEVVSGQVTLGASVYVISGTWNPSNGDIALTSSPALPAGVNPVFYAPINYEHASMGEKVASVSVAYDQWPIFATPTRGIVTTTIDAKTQMSGELGIDPLGESQVALLTQIGNERHVEAVRRMREIADGLPAVQYDFSWPSRSPQLSRSQIFGDFAPTLAQANMSMIALTMDHGVSHAYVGRRLAAIMMSLPPDMFTPSGLRPTVGIWRIGTFMGSVSVYYDPRANTYETASTSKMLLIGKGTDPARNPMVFGDVTAPIIQQLGNTTSQVIGATFYSKGFAAVNPHKPSACSAVNVEIINIG